ncbi:MAG TPA: DUF4142 domain-containing protein [Chitinophagaceae bacterium]
MKKILFILFIAPLAFACNNSSSDSVEKADSTNNVKADSSSTSTSTTDTSSNKMTGSMPVDKSTANFMVKVADVGMTEVKLGQMAQDKGMNQGVKDFGAMMVRDHTNAGDELKKLAGNKNVTLPAMIGADHQKKIDDLAKKSGKDFDKAYISAMVSGHEATVDDFKKASGDTKDPDVKTWIDRTLPTLQMHLDSAKAIQKRIK